MKAMAAIRQFDELAGNSLSLECLVIKAAVVDEHCLIIHGMSQERGRRLPGDLAFTREPLDLLQGGFLAQEIVARTGVAEFSQRTPPDRPGS